MDVTLDDKSLAEPSAIAALMLIESLMLALMETRLVGHEEIAGVIEDVVANQRAMAAESGDPAVVQVAERMVHRIADRLAGAVRAPVVADRGATTGQRPATR